MSKISKISKKAVAQFVSARYPDYRRDRAAGGWSMPGQGQFLSDDAARAEAVAELELARDGVAVMPEWAL